MKINVTWSKEENSKLAGKTCAKKVVLDLIETKIAIMFNSNKYNQEEFMSGAKSVLGTAPIIGYSSNEGIITKEGYLSPDKSNFAGMMAIGDNETKVGTAICPKMGKERDIGRLVAKQAMEKVGTKSSPAYYIMFVLSGSSEEYAKGIKDIIGDVPCFGGKCEKESKIFNEDMVLNSGVVVAFFYTNKKIESIFDSKYHETINSGVITKANNNRLYEIDGIKALKRYCEWTDKKVRDVKDSKIYKESILMPLAVKTNDGLSIIKHPILGNNDYSIDLKHKIAVNTAIIQMQMSKDELIKEPSLLLRLLKKKSREKEKGYLLFLDAEKKNILEEEEKEDLALKLKNEAKDTPFIAAFMLSEFGKGENTINNFGKLMSTLLSFCD